MTWQSYDFKKDEGLTTFHPAVGRSEVVSPDLVAGPKDDEEREIA